MIKLSRTYKMTSIMLLAIIVSHLFVFHFAMEDEMLCIGEGEHFHIEKTFDIDSVDLNGTGNTEVQNDFNCTDYRLDNHVDENYAKIKRIAIYLDVQIINFEKEVLSKRNISNSVYLYLNANNKFIIDKLSTTQILI